MLRQLVKVVIEEGDEKEIREYHVDRLKFKSRHRKDNQKLSKEEMEQLKLLEKQDEGTKLD